MYNNSVTLHLDLALQQGPILKKNKIINCLKKELSLDKCSKYIYKHLT